MRKNTGALALVFTISFLSINARCEKKWELTNGIEFYLTKADFDPFIKKNPARSVLRGAIGTVYRDYSTPANAHLEWEVKSISNIKTNISGQEGIPFGYTIGLYRSFFEKFPIQVGPDFLYINGPRTTLSASGTANTEVTNWYTDSFVRNENLFLLTKEFTLETNYMAPGLNLRKRFDFSKRTSLLLGGGYAYVYGKMNWAEDFEETWYGGAWKAMLAFQGRFGPHLGGTINFRSSYIDLPEKPNGQYYPAFDWNPVSLGIDFGILF